MSFSSAWSEENALQYPHPGYCRSHGFHYTIYSDFKKHTIQEYKGVKFLRLRLHNALICLKRKVCRPLSVLFLAENLTQVRQREKIVLQNG